LKCLLYHLQHEGTPISEKIIPSSYPTKHLVNDSNLSSIGGNETAGLCQYTYHRGLPEESRLSALIRTGNEMEM